MRASSYIAYASIGLLTINKSQESQRLASRYIKVQAGTPCFGSVRHSVEAGLNTPTDGAYFGEAEASGASFETMRDVTGSIEVVAGNRSAGRAEAGSDFARLVAEAQEESGA